MIELRLLGALALVSADGAALDSVLTQPKRTALLCYLAVSSRRGFRRRDTLLALFWPEHDAEQARHALRQSLYFVRRALGPGALVSRGDDELTIAPDLMRCDVVEFERALDERRLADALALYQGELLPGFYLSDAPEFERWLEAERSRLRQRASEAAWAFAESLERDGNSAMAAEWAQRAADFSPGEETALRRLVELLNRLGDRSAAVRAYDAFARTLEREYELTPSSETRALLARIRATRSVDGATATSAPVVAAAVSEPAHAEPVALATPPFASTPRTRPKISARVLFASAAVIALVVGSAWRVAARARPAPTPLVRERVVIADFSNRTSDSTFGDLVAHILRSELARSPLLRVVGQETTADALRRMRRPPTTRLTADVARELAAREEIKVVVQGDVRATGAGFVISGTVVETASGDAIYGASETAVDSTEALPAIERLSDDIRHGIGETLASIHSGDSLYRFTTSSLPALRKHMQGSAALVRGDFATSAELLEEAIALDPEFAHAYLLLWAALGNAGMPSGRLLRPLMRAYELRDQLTDRERYAVEALYFLNVTGDLPKSLAAFRKHVDALKRLPMGEAGWYASYGATLQLTGDLAEAERVLDEALVRHPTAANLTVRVSVLYALGKDADAKRALDDAARVFPGQPLVLAARVGLLADSGRYDDAHTVASLIRRDANVLYGLRLEAELDAMRGRVGEAIGHLRALQEAMLARHDVASALELAAAIGRMRLLAGDSSAAKEVDVLLVQHPIESVDVLSRPYLSLAMFYADAGRTRRARTLLNAYEQELPRELRGPDEWRLHRARATMFRADGDPRQALAERLLSARTPALRLGLFDDPSVPGGDQPELARDYAALGATDSAVVVYERYLAVRSLSRVGTDAFELGGALERESALLEARGDVSRAADRARRLATLWSGADERFRIRAQQALRRAERLGASLPPIREVRGRPTR